MARSSVVRQPDQRRDVGPFVRWSASRTKRDGAVRPLVRQPDQARDVAMGSDGREARQLPIDRQVEPIPPFGPAAVVNGDVVVAQERERER